MYGNNIYGTLAYSKESLIQDGLQPYTPNLMKYLPTYYRDSKVIKNIEIDVFAPEIAILNYRHEDLLKQLFLDTATWSLDIREKELGIQTDLNKSYEERREIIKAKLRGSGTVTKTLIKNVSRAFSGGDVEVIENFSDYSFIIQFIGIKGIPKNMAGLIDAIEDIKPAHLGYYFKYTYTVWDFIENSKLTWNGAKLKTWNDLKVYE